MSSERAIAARLREAEPRQRDIASLRPHSRASDWGGSAYARGGVLSFDLYPPDLPNIELGPMAQFPGRAALNPTQ
jgi:hypothetical protein